MFQEPSVTADGQSAVAAAAARPAGSSPIDRVLTGELVAALWRRRAWILAGMLVGIAVAVVFLLAATPRYTALAQLLIDPADLRVINNTVTTQNAPTDANIAQAESQVRVLVSEQVLRRVVETQRLDQDPEFAKPGSGLEAALRALARWFGASPANELPDPIVRALRVLEQVALARRQERTYVVDLSVTTARADKSMAIVNAIIRAYFEDQASSRSDVARRATTALSSRLQELKDRVRAAEERVEQYKAQFNIVGAGGQLVNEQQLTELNNQLTLARARTAEAKARLEHVRRLQRSGTDPGAIAEAVQSPTVASLRAQYAEVVRREAELTARLGALHPSVIDIKAQVHDLQQLIAAEVARLSASIRGDYERAQANEDALAQRLEALKREALSMGQALVRLRELERDVDASRAVYEAFLVRSRETSEQGRLDTANVRVISEPTLPVKGWPPRPWLVLAAALMVGGVVGGGLGLARERTDDRIWSRAGFEAAYRLPVLAEISGADAGRGHIGGLRRMLLHLIAGARGAPTLAAAIDAPDSPTRLEFQRLHRVLLRASATPHRVVLFLAPGEPGARATAALKFALAAAATRSRVLLVDGDITHRRLSSLVVGGSGAGLIDVADGRVRFEDALVPERQTGLKVLQAGRASGSWQLDRDKIIAVFDQARGFDTVVVDASADRGDVLAPTLAAAADVAVLVVTLGVTRHRDVAAFVATPEFPAAKLRGAILIADLEARA